MFRLFRRPGKESGVSKEDGARFRVSPDVKASEHAEGVVLIHLVKGTVFSTNCVGAMIWNGAVERRSVQQVAAAISNRFHLPPQDVEQDTEEFLAQLAAEGLVVAEGR
jgi:hypothetical protein